MFLMCTAIIKGYNRKNIKKIISVNYCRPLNFENLPTVVEKKKKKKIVRTCHLIPCIS